MNPFCAMSKGCKSFTPDDLGECLHFSSAECKFVSDRKYDFACSVCIHSETRHVDPRCKTCRLKDAVAFAPAQEPVLV